MQTKLLIVKSIESYPKDNRISQLRKKGKSLNVLHSKQTVTVLI